MYKLKTWNAWGDEFQSSVSSILGGNEMENPVLMTYKHVPLLLRGGPERRSCRSIAEQPSTPDQLRSTCLNKYKNFLNSALQQLQKYFEDKYPTWLKLAEILFLFIGARDDTLSISERIELRLAKLEDLMKCELINPLTPDEKQVLRAQYKTLFIRSIHIVNEVKREIPTLFENEKPISVKIVNNLVWYDVCSKEEYFHDIKNIIEFSLRFLIRDANECSVETLIGDVDHVKSIKRTKLQYENLHKQLFIRENGPHPLLSDEIRKKALNELYPRGWHFLKSQVLTSSTSSKVFQSHLNRARLNNTYCFDL